jgi:hypothetical protein
MKMEDWANFEKPTWHVFSEEELELGDIPEIKNDEEKGDTREAKKAERLAQR